MNIVAFITTTINEHLQLGNGKFSKEFETDQFI